MRERGSFAIERLRRRGRLFARDLRLGHIGGRRWPPYLRSAAVTLILALATALVVAQNFLPNRLNLRAGDVSSQDVVSQQSVRYESQTKRDEARAAATAQVPDQFDTSVSIQQRQAIDSLATRVGDLRQSSSSGPDRSAQLSLLEPQLSDAQRQYLLQADGGTVATIFKSAGDILQQLESNGIKFDTLKSAQDSAQTRAAALHLDATGASTVAALVRAHLKVNFLQAETALKRQQASDAIPPVFVNVAQGQTIIRYGDLVTPFQLEEAQAVGLLAPRTDWARILAVFMLVIILFAVALGYLMQFRPAILRDPRQLGTLGGLMLLLLVVAKLAVPLNPVAQYLVPMAAVPLLVAALMDTGLGIIVALAVGLLTGIIADNVLPLTLVGFLGGSIGAIYVHRLERLGQWVTAGILVAGAQFVTLVSLSLIERHQSLDEILSIGGLALISGLLSALIAGGDQADGADDPQQSPAETADDERAGDLQPLDRGRQPGGSRGRGGRRQPGAGSGGLLLPRHRQDSPASFLRREPGGHWQHP
ncbi:MAG: hypothetical protein E6I84_14225 [Chloroflexi bacterium]|nr:MAG: hypothetical protein E6I84_14225 [Chloroflexota bacterium]